MITYGSSSLFLIYRKVQAHYSEHYDVKDEIIHSIIHSFIQYSFQAIFCLELKRSFQILWLVLNHLWSYET